MIPCPAPFASSGDEGDVPLGRETEAPACPGRLTGVGAACVPGVWLAGAERAVGTAARVGPKACEASAVGAECVGAAGVEGATYTGRWTSRVTAGTTGMAACEPDRWVSHVEGGTTGMAG
ncbi:MAG: hypothetical protein KGO50_03730 [Myxococcales bacterium]|nr:hypothetical protein [Myxococcales bacterium]